MRRALWLTLAVAAFALPVAASGEEPVPDATSSPPDGGVLPPAELVTEVATDAGAASSETLDLAASLPLPSEAKAASSAGAWEKVLEVTGYLDSRTAFTRSRTWGLVPTDTLPQLQELVELNTQLKVKVRERSYLSSDVSLVANIAGQYHGRDASGQDVQVANQPAVPVVSLNELYLFHDFVPQLNVVVGKKRIVWGSGLAFNPTDLLNPRRDPTDPTFQRAGAWVAQVEAPFETMTFSVLFAPTLLASTSGIPTAFMLYPTWDRRDDLVHYQLAARWYALIADADVTLMAFYGNASVDVFRDKLRFGVSFSRYFFTDYELHFEALFQQGSARDSVVSPCATSPTAAAVCSIQGTPFMEKRLLGDAAVYPRVLVGTKRQFSDDSMVSLEYLYQADGWTKSQFQDYANGLGLIEAGRALGLPVQQLAGVSSLLGQAGGDGLPTRFNFDPRGQHYLFLSVQKPRLFDDFTLQLVLVANLSDLSTMWTPSIAWSATEWLTVTLYGFLPLQGPDGLAVKTPAGTPVSEFGVSPFAVRAMLEARAYF